MQPPQHPAWCVRGFRCTADRTGGWHRSSLHVTASDLHWWLQQGVGEPTLLALAAGEGRVLVPAAQVAVLGTVGEAVLAALAGVAGQPAR